MPFSPPSSFLAELEARQDAVMLELDELDRRIEQAIAEYAAYSKPGTIPLRPALSIMPAPENQAAAS